MAGAKQRNGHTFEAVQVFGHLDGIVARAGAVGAGDQDEQRFAGGVHDVSGYCTNLHEINIAACGFVQYRVASLI
nr:hypothetical protein RAR13_10260 [Aminobacter aminovorans]